MKFLTVALLSKLVLAIRTVFFDCQDNTSHFENDVSTESNEQSDLAPFLEQEVSTIFEQDRRNQNQDDFRDLPFHHVKRVYKRFLAAPGVISNSDLPLNLLVTSYQDAEELLKIRLLLAERKVEKQLHLTVQVDSQHNTNTDYAGKQWSFEDLEEFADDLRTMPDLKKLKLELLELDHNRLQGVYEIMREMVVDGGFRALAKFRLVIVNQHQRVRKDDFESVIKKFKSLGKLATRKTKLEIQLDINEALQYDPEHLYRMRAEEAIFQKRPDLVLKNWKQAVNVLFEDFPSLGIYQNEREQWYIQALTSIVTRTFNGDVLSTLRNDLAGLQTKHDAHQQWVKNVDSLFGIAGHLFTAFPKRACSNMFELRKSLYDETISETGDVAVLADARDALLQLLPISNGDLSTINFAIYNQWQEEFTHFCDGRYGKRFLVPEPYSTNPILYEAHDDQGEWRRTNILQVLLNTFRSNGIMTRMKKQVEKLTDHEFEGMISQDSMWFHLLIFDCMNDYVQLNTAEQNYIPTKFISALIEQGVLTKISSAGWDAIKADESGMDSDVFDVNSSPFALQIIQLLQNGPLPEEPDWRNSAEQTTFELGHILFRHSNA